MIDTLILLILTFLLSLSIVPPIVAWWIYRRHK